MSSRGEKLIRMLVRVFSGQKLTSPENSVKQLLSRTDLFRKLSSKRLNILCQAVGEVTYKAQEPIFEEGDDGDVLYLIRHGTVRIVTRDLHGDPIVLARLEEGDYFGEQALLDETPGPRNASASAVSDTTLLTVTHADFRTVVDSTRRLKKALQDRGRKQFVKKWAHQCQVFGSIDRNLIKQLAGKFRKYDDGEVIFSQGDRSDGTYFLTQGDVRIRFTQKDDQSSETWVSSGRIFGELGVLWDAPRTGTAIAAGPVQTLFFDKKSFLKLYRTRPDLAHHLKDLESIYQIPKRGVVSVHQGEYLGRDCISSLFQLEDGRSVLASKVRGESIFAMTELGTVSTESVSYHVGKLRRELGIAGGRLISIVSHGYWPELDRTCAMLLAGESLKEWQPSLFRASGGLEIQEAAIEGGAGDLVCNCMQIPFARIREVIDAEHANLEAVCHATGAGTVCGSCLPRIRYMLGNTYWMPAHIDRVIPRSPEIRTYQLRLFSGHPEPYEPGQHIVVQTLIEQRFVARTYTLTSVPDESDFYEITVKREEHGYFSRWLFGHETEQPFLRISQPNGGRVHQMLDAAAIVCLVAGIGITPAVALARYFLKERKTQCLHIDYSAHEEGDLIFADELAQICQGLPSVTFHQRVTAETGRITEQEIHVLAREHHGARFFLCGPSAFEKATRSALSGAGVEPHAILSEEFTHAGAPLPTRAPAPA